MPVNGTPIEQGYSRAHGINVTQTDTIDFINSQAVTMYYPVNNQEQRYYIPMTQYIESDEDEMIKSIVTSLLDGPGSQSVMQVFNSQAMLVEEPVLSDGVLELTFNEAILMEEGQAIIADEAMETLVRTLTSQEAVEAVHVNVENVETILSENGESYSEPVTTDLLNTSERF
jgi:germination protein M